MCHSVGLEVEVEFSWEKLEARLFASVLIGGGVDKEVLFVVALSVANLGLVTVEKSIVSIRALASMLETNRDSTVEVPPSGSALLAFR